MIVDSFSKDGTVELAKRLGADVYQNLWVDYATQLNWGLEHTDIDAKWTITLEHDFLDKNTKSLEWWIGKHNWYSNREVQDYLDKQRQLEEDDTIRPRLFGNQAERKK